MGGRAKDIFGELIPLMPKPTSTCYSEAILRCKAHVLLDKTLAHTVCLFFGKQADVRDVSECLEMIKQLDNQFEQIKKCNMYTFSHSNSLKERFTPGVL